MTIKHRKNSLNSNALADKPRFKRPVPVREEPKSANKPQWPVITLTVITIVTTLLTLIGYGVAISAESMMGVPHQSLFTSPFELLGLSIWAILRLISRVEANLNFWQHYFTIMGRIAPVFAVAFLVTLVGVVALHYQWFRRMTKGEFPGWVTKVSRRLKVRTELSTKVSRITAYFSALLIALPLVLVMSVILTVFPVVVLSVFPAIGMTAGEAHIQKYVIGPARCEPVFNRKIRLAGITRTKEPTATCLKVTNDRRSLGVGRSVFVTSSAVILFNPDTGTVWRAPTKDAVVETVGQTVPSSGPQAGIGDPGANLGASAPPAD